MYGETHVQCMCTALCAPAHDRMRSLIRPLMKRRRGTCSARSEFCLSLFGILAFGFKPNLAQAVSLLFASEWCFIDCCQIVSKKNGVPFGLGLKPKSF